MTIKLYADSASDLPIAFFEENGVQLVPLQVHIDKEEYKDLLTIQPKQVYEEIRAGKMPKTSQASPQLFEELFIDLAKSGESGLYIALSSELSGTYQTAVMMYEQVKEDYPNLDLTIIDSKCVSLGFGLLVLAAAEQIKLGASKEAIIQDLEFRCAHMEHLFTVEDLDFLAKGGRLSKASAFLGGLLNIKPLLHVEDGKLVPLEKIRGKKKLIKRMLDLMDERGVDLENQTVGISHGDDIETALELKKMIEERFGTKNFYINLIGSVVASHAGPGTLALFFLNDKQS
ncbi:DegV family protein [Lederbergia citrea]|uniref:DegV family protein n=1 Tax=Lederbergia citrea TaxID=2833581 RepID=A0A942UM57_9BACI|nr:DegV family protein [Lederbergia citrea]MBS4177419.1 DegV family protein [Lederbergia citrea]MBS4204097.1 DegV family protein [Lederbergia citrea]MBS4221318.1 DegV family protein [Lederbergia citrea]